MKRLILTAIAFIILPGNLWAAPMGESAGHDLDDLWVRAQSHYDLSEEDAVILLESHQVALTFDGALQTRVHRVVWIGTTVGIRSYADLRIPWNTDTSTLDVEILRTWREGQWWPDASKISDTAVVHTLPHAMDRADDYTIMRETMLLHDGVELGCIMETAYTITERDVPAAGGIFVVPQRDPAVLTQLRVMARPGLDIKHEALNGMSVAQSINPTKGQGLLWERRYCPALGQPVTASPESYEPAVAWSTWDGWPELADHWLGAVDAAAVLDSDHAAGFQNKLHPAMSQRQKLAAVGDYLNEMVRRIHYSDRFWRFDPRPAARTLATAYGHDLDRAVLGAALLKQAGLTVEPMFVGSGTDLVARAIPRFQDTGRILLRIPLIMDGYLDPTAGQAVGRAETYGHPFWYVAGENMKEPHPPQLPQAEKSLKTGISLEPGDDGRWTGSGYARAVALFSPYSKVIAGEDFATGFVGPFVGSVVPGAKVTSASPREFNMDLVEVTFDLEIEELQTDGRDRRQLLIGAPADGLLTKLPRDVHLYQQMRGTPVSGLEYLEQTVMVRIMVDPADVISKPSSKKLENKAGFFHLEVVEEDGWLILTRSIKLTGSFIPAADWPHLRALLLEESDPANGMVLLNSF